MKADPATIPFGVGWLVGEQARSPAAEAPGSHRRKYHRQFRKATSSERKRDLNGESVYRIKRKKLKNTFFSLKFVFRKTTICPMRGI